MEFWWKRVRRLEEALREAGEALSKAFGELFIADVLCEDLRMKNKELKKSLEEKEGEILELKALVAKLRGRQK